MEMRVILERKNYVSVTYLYGYEILVLINCPCMFVVYHAGWILNSNDFLDYLANFLPDYLTHYYIALTLKAHI